MLAAFRGNQGLKLRMAVTLCVAALLGPIGPARADSPGSFWDTLDVHITPRSFLASATGLLDHRIYLFGGMGKSTVVEDTAESFDPTTRVVRKVRPMPARRWDFAAAAGFDDRIYVLGGVRCTPTCSLSPSVDAYDPATDRWSEVEPMPTPRSGLAATRGLDGKIYAIGGVGTDEALSTVEAYDPATNTWSGLRPMPTPRTHLSAVTGLDGLIYAIGGQSKDASVRADVEVYDPTAGTWGKVKEMPTPRWGLASVVDASGTLYAMGGKNAKSQVVPNVETYTPKADVWADVDALPSPRMGLTAATDASGAIFAIGGSDNVPSYATDFPTTIEGHGATPIGPRGGAGSWTSLASLLTGREGLAATTDAEGRIYAIGGFGEDGPPVSAAEVWNPSAGDSWTSIPEMPTPRALLGAAVSSGAVLSLPTIYAIGGARGASSAIDGPGAEPAVSLVDAPQIWSSSESRWVPTSWLRGRDCPFPDNTPAREIGCPDAYKGELDTDLPGFDGELYIAYAWRAHGGTTWLSPLSAISVSDIKEGHAIDIKLPPIPPEASAAEVYLFPHSNGARELAQYQHGALAAVIDPNVPQPRLLLPGGVSKTAGTQSLHGVGATFSRDLNVGQRIWVRGGLAEDGTPLFGVEETAVVQTITSDEELSVDVMWTNTASGQAVLRDRLDDIRLNPEVILTSLPPRLAKGVPTANTTGDVIGAVEAYTPALGTWSTAPASLPTARWGLAAVSDKQGRIYAIGGNASTGITANGTPLPADWPATEGSFEVADSNAEAWCSTALDDAHLAHACQDRGIDQDNICLPRVLLAATLGSDGRIYILGGNDGQQPTNTLQIYDPKAPTSSTRPDQCVKAASGVKPAGGHWTLGKPMRTARQALAAVTGPDGRIYAIGGDTVGASHLSTLEAYDPTTDTWETLKPMPTGRRALAAASPPGVGAILAIGGHSEDPPFDAVEAYTP